MWIDWIMILRSKAISTILPLAIIHALYGNSSSNKDIKSTKTAQPSLKMNFTQTGLKTKLIMLLQFPIQITFSKEITTKNVWLVL